jgi:hypothetical protein
MANQYCSRRPVPRRREMTLLGGAVATILLLLSSAQAAAGTNLVIWDTGSPLSTGAGIEARDTWKLVPSDLILLEVDPAKSASDPGYYGRDYVFRGDTVVESQALVAAFLKDSGIQIYSKPAATESGTNATPTRLTKVAELQPLAGDSEASKISHCEIVRHNGDQIVLQVSFGSEGSAVFTFGKFPFVGIKTSGDRKGFRIASPIRYGIVPSFIGDDLIYDPAEYGSAPTLHLPSEKMFVGLLRGEAQMLVLDWPSEQQQLSLRLGNSSDGHRLIEAVDLETAGQSFYLAVPSSPGIWHREELTSSYLETDVALDWKMPFPARWKTELNEAGVKTSFAFHDSKGNVWRGVPGSYTYPVWFEGDRATYHLSKKVPPEGESLIYFLEGNGTPDSIWTPADVLNASLGSDAATTILDPDGRKLRTHHRRGADGVRRACTCGCTEAIQAIFEAGEEVDRKADINEEIKDMIYFVQRHVARINEYQRFAADLTAFLRSKEEAEPELKSYLQGLELAVQEIPDGYNVEKENMKSLSYADELARKTMALTAKKDTNNVPAYMELLKDWRGMGGSQDYVLAHCHQLTRKLFQEAGYTCVNQPKAVKVAEQVRQRCRQMLRNPDGYEIWANY